MNKEQQTEIIKDRTYHQALEEIGLAVEGHHYISTLYYSDEQGRRKIQIAPITISRAEDGPRVWTTYFRPIDIGPIETVEKGGIKND